MSLGSASTQGAANIEPTVGSERHDEANTRLHGRWLMLARVVWFIVVTLALLVFIFSLPVYIAQLYRVCTGNACGTGQLTPQIVETF